MIQNSHPTKIKLPYQRLTLSPQISPLLSTQLFSSSFCFHLFHPSLFFVNRIYTKYKYCKSELSLSLSSDSHMCKSQRLKRIIIHWFFYLFIFILIFPPNVEPEIFQRAWRWHMWRHLQIDAQVRIGGRCLGSRPHAPPRVSEYPLSCGGPNIQDVLCISCIIGNMDTLINIINCIDVILIKVPWSVISFVIAIFMTELWTGHLLL